MLAVSLENGLDVRFRVIRDKEVDGCVPFGENRSLLAHGEATQTWDCFVFKAVNSVPTQRRFIQHVQQETFPVPWAPFMLMFAYKKFTGWCHL